MAFGNGAHVLVAMYQAGTLGLRRRRNNRIHQRQALRRLADDLKCGQGNRLIDGHNL